MITRFVVICLSGMLLSAAAVVDQDRVVDARSNQRPAPDAAADQGRSEDPAQHEESNRTHVGPVRWMAPESMREKGAAANGSGGDESASDQAAATAERIQHRQEFGQTQGSRTRWMAPEAIQEKRATAIDVAGSTHGATQTRDENDKGKTDKRSETRAGKKGSVPCPAPVGSAEPTDTASGAASATGGGCGTP